MSAQYVIRLKALELKFDKLLVQMQDVIGAQKAMAQAIAELESRPIPSGRPRKVENGTTHA